MSPRLRLVPPPPDRSPDRPGPGPVPPQVLRSLDLAVMRRVESLIPGEHLTPQVGGGTDLAMIRPYRPGDDVRHLDWNVTARMNEPHVRVHVGERALNCWLLLDVAPGTRFPPHHHGGAEECYVISGSLYACGKKIYAGDFHHADGETEQCRQDRLQP